MKVMPDLHYKQVVGATLFAAVVAAYIAGIPNLENSSVAVNLKAAELNITGIATGPWRPIGGVMGGQGCGGPIVHEGAGCGPGLGEDGYGPCR
jgi:hypothetical protein